MPGNADGINKPEFLLDTSLFAYILGTEARNCVVLC